MTLLIKVIICVSILVMSQQDILAQVINNAMTLNIRYDNPNDGVDRWDNRKSELVALVNYYQPEVLGLQEALSHQLGYIDDHLTDYTMIGVGRDDGKDKGEFTAIFYDSTLFAMLESSTFWLSEEPESVSIGWDAALERICTYALLENKVTYERLLVFNTHYDHRGVKAREMSSRLLVDRMQDINSSGYPVILMGDFNSEPQRKPISVLLDYMADGGSLAPNGLYGPIGTYSGFDKDAMLNRRIDYVFVKNIGVRSYRHIDDRKKDGHWISDHLPVFIVLE